MKFLRKLVALLVGLVFFAALVISIGMIFAVKNFNITLITYADDCTDSYNEAKSSLSRFKGGSILFLDENDIVEAVSQSNFTVSEIEKKFPCTVNITLRERLETFAISVGGLYYMYDNDGRFLRSCLDNTNINDGSPNVELTGIADNNISYIAGIAAIFKDSFKSLRSAVTCINVDSKPEVEGYSEKLYFNMRCGLKIQLDDYTNDTEEKILAAYKEFCELTDRQKLSGTVRSYRIGGEEGLINADYSKF